jgi:multidrug resistance efflux pump
LLALILLGGIVLLLFPRQPSSAPVTSSATAPLIAHGQVLPARQARVGTQGGGVVQQLTVSPGDDVAGQTPLAWLLGASGTEIVTAPYGGTVTNVLIHTGDTLVPGATIAIVADLHVLQVETNDVAEVLGGKPGVGQRVQISVDALDNVVLTGVVSNVARLPQTGSTGTAAYPVIISVGGFPPAVRPGMSVRITIPDAASSST